MRALRFVALALTLSPAAFSPAAFAQDWARTALEASPRHGEWVALDAAGGRTLHAFVVYPESKTKAPVVLVIHEIFGLSEWAMSMADQLAAAGCIAIAPDLLSGDGPDKGRTKDFPNTTAAREAVGKLAPERVTADLDLAADYAVKLPASNGKLVVAGFCWGGAQTFRYANHKATLAGAFVFYGTGPTTAEGVATIACPVYGFYAENDARVNATLEGSAAAMKAAGKTFEPVTYAGGGHGFMRAGDDPAGTEANKAARAKAWERLNALLKPHLTE